MDKSYIFLKSPIGSGGEANIYTVRIRPELVAKIYHQPHGDYARKLAFMVANPPIDPLASSGRVSIAWATELVTDLGLVVGFLMPKLDTSKAKPIFQYYNPSTRRKETPWFSYLYLLRAARNLAAAVNSVHARGYVIGDVNESNILVGVEDVIVTLVDTDSFQVNDGTTVYRCTVGKPEYTPPELQGMSFRDVDRSVEHDLFGLGVLIYQLLMEGTHPFGGVFTGQGEAPELKDRIKSGHFPHGRCRVPYKPMPLAPSFQMLPVALQELFLLCFEAGHGNPAARPTAEVWSKTLGVAEDGLIKCGVNGQHYYSGHLGVCPWCERAVKLRGRDPFPALDVSSGQHLKPTAIGKAYVSEENLTIDLGNGSILELVRVPAGKFMMGSPDGEGDYDERPQHQVILKEFLIGKYAVTNAQWQAVMKKQGSTNCDKKFQGDLQPVVGVSWHEARAFCQKLSQQTGRAVRLPTEAEWEYAARGANQSKGYEYSGSNNLDEVRWYDENSGGNTLCKKIRRLYFSVRWYDDNSGNNTHPVGQKKANELGIYDMSGNVWEWCLDECHDSYADKPEKLKSNGNEAWGDLNVDDNDNRPRRMRGGSWNSSARLCRTANRFGYFAREQKLDFGFRLFLVSSS
jgi:formylglycine-generating enzyme required for sulfatase activity